MDRIIKILTKIAFVFVILLLFNSPVSYASELAGTESEESEEEVADTRVIPIGVSIQGINVSGMTVDEAKEVIAEYFSSYDDIEFTIIVKDKTITATGADLAICAKNDDVAVRAATVGSYGNLAERYKDSYNLKNGITKNFKVSVGADAPKIVEYLEGIAKKVDVKPVNNGLIRENGQFRYVEGKPGEVVRISKSASDIVDYLEYSWDGGPATFTLTTEVADPQGTQEDLATITDILGSFNTDYSSSSAARKNNVANGAKLVNGHVLYPGEEFSVLDAITPFTAENGYQLAGSYENGTTVETYGGGICQVSTTLYGAVRASEVEVVTRSCHSMVVNYVLPSNDAAISESGSKDFQIRNNKETPIYLEGYVENNKIYFNIWGREDRPATHKVEYETEVTEVTIQDTTFVAEPGLPLGQMKVVTGGHTGYVARLWKIITEGGEETMRKVYNNSRYNPSNRTIAVGIATDIPGYADIMNGAIASQNPDVIANAIATYAPGVQNSVSFTIVPQYSVTVKEEPAPTPDDGITNDASTVNETTGEVIIN